jgi:hypothetical protein
MRTRRRTPAQRLAVQTLELSIAAPQVVAHRLARMAAAGANPSARAKREIAQMSTEKISAFYASWAAMWTAALQGQMRFAQSMPAIMLSAATGRRSRRTPSLTRLTNEVTKIATAGLAPVRAKAVANAKRLSRR